jgi:predicted ATPase
MQDGDELQSSINRLINAEIFSQRGQTPKAHYRFQHALLREAAYHSLLKRTRQKYHQRISILIKEHFPSITTENPEILAHHFSMAGNYSEALNYWLAAGRYATQRSANIEATAHLNNGLAILNKIPNSAQRDLHELALQTTLGLAVMMSKGYAAAEVERAYARAHELCKNITDENTVFPISCGLWEFYIVRGDLNKASKLASELQKMAASSTAQCFREEAQRALGTTQFWKGELSEALKNLQLPLDTENKTTPATLVSYSQDACVAAHANASCVLWLLGQPKQAMEHGKHALQLAKSLSHPFSQAYALNFLGTLSQLCGDRTLTYQYADAQITLSETYGFSFWSATGKMLKAWAESPNQPPEVTCQIFQEALRDYENSGNQLARPYFQAVLVDLLQNAGQHFAGLEIIDQTLLETSRNGEEFFTAELLRLKGELSLTQDSPDYCAAESLFIQAYQQAKQQKSNALALKALTSLAQLLGKTALENNFSGHFITP